MTHADQQTATLSLTSAPLWQRVLCGWAGRLTHGHLTLLFPDGKEHHVAGREAGPSAVLKLNNARPVWRVMSGGTLGFSRSYMDGDWDSPDIAGFLELAIVNEGNWHGLMSPSALLGKLALLRHKLRRNSKAGSRRNIAFHYDLGNAFYRHWLDETMTYSSALYTHAHQSLGEAQAAKYQRIVEQLALGPEDHVLEIGCGWGGFAEHAIRASGCRVTGLTLSTEQAAYARQRMQAAGYADRCDIRLEDYRDVQGRFTKIVSIEMFEAVGEENWPVYFNRVRDLLVDGGKAVVQVITLDEGRFEQYQREADFIQTYIFPGGMLPSVERFEISAMKAGLKTRDTFRFGLDYERTLLTWDKSFTAHWSKITPLGFDERFFRMWRYYLHYCAAGFRTGRLDVVQFELEK
ncbi:methyltransferase domain-containing protein [Agrobacterium vitis]|uniref:class I SAM-dependent methyltransferase n=1 Tax=Agrobacterium vitis TaxID=373 RepID=UPI0012E94D44|nr:cyclopropane-fatty-acyl-phospholipid synthase family protein [Agrobacterium vitis]MCF1469724.1 class I SAM-dependent methyltransferase [Agrobacterium vitis]MVA80996.1 methyltransferase domain-containing protein [Agrobacterium vitis]